MLTAAEEFTILAQTIGFTSQHRGLVNHFKLDGCNDFKPHLAVLKKFYDRGDQTFSMDIIQPLLSMSKELARKAKWDLKLTAANQAAIGLYYLRYGRRFEELVGFHDDLVESYRQRFEAAVLIDGMLPLYEVSAIPSGDRLKECVEELQLIIGKRDGHYVITKVLSDVQYALPEYTRERAASYYLAALDRLPAEWKPREEISQRIVEIRAALHGELDIEAASEWAKVHLATLDVILADTITGGQIPHLQVGITLALWLELGEVSVATGAWYVDWIANDVYQMALDEVQLTHGHKLISAAGCKKIYDLVKMLGKPESMPGGVMERSNILSTIAVLAAQRYPIYALLKLSGASDDLYTEVFQTIDETRVGIL